MRDVQFAYLLIQNKEAVIFDILHDYIARKKQSRDKDKPDLQRTFLHLEEILEMIRKGNRGFSIGRKGTEQIRENLYHSLRFIFWGTYPVTGENQQFGLD